MGAPDGDPPGPTTCDTLFGGRLVLTQPARGHRAGTDAVLLAAAVPRSFAGLVCDAGAGVGTVGLALAQVCPAARVVLVENEAFTASLAERNIAANGLEGRVRLVHRDLLERGGTGELADLLVTNPPFYEPGRIRPPDDARRRAAYVTGEGGLAGWIAACLADLSGRGTLVMIHTVEALPQALDALSGRAGALTVLPVHARSDAPAKRVLLRAVKGSRAPMTLRPGLVLHEADGSFTPLADRLHRGEAALPW